MPAPELTPIDNPRAEFVALQKKQWAALDRAVYLGMTPEEARSTSIELVGSSSFNAPWV